MIWVRRLLWVLACFFIFLGLAATANYQDHYMMIFFGIALVLVIFAEVRIA